MRKLFAVLMAVLMLASVLAVIPAAAAEETNAPSYAGNSTGLLISEILHNPDHWNEQEYTSAGDCFAFWEIYNGSDDAINIYDYSLVAAPMYNNIPTAGTVYYNVWDLWENDKKFVHKADISTNVVPSKPTTETGEPVNIPEGLVLQNDGEKGTINPGECAVIWFINSAAIKHFQDLIDRGEVNSGADLDVRALFIEQWSNLENGVTVDSDMKIYLIWAYSAQIKTETGYDPNPDYFGDSDGSKTAGMMYGLVKDAFQLSDSAVNEDGSLNANVAALAPYAGSVASWKLCKGNLSTIYVPSNTKPQYHIADRAYDGKPLTEAEQVDYLTAGLVEAYIEAGCVESTAVATPGSLDAMQYALAFADKAPTSISGGQADWAASYLAERFAYLFPAEGDIEDANDEEEIIVKPPKREELQKIFFNDEEDQWEYITRLSLVGKILIAVGAVVVVGAGAAAAVIIVKKKKA